MQGFTHVCHHRVWCMLCLILFLVLPTSYFVHVHLLPYPSLTANGGRLWWSSPFELNVVRNCVLVLAFVSSF